MLEAGWKKIHHTQHLHSRDFPREVSRVKGMVADTLPLSYAGQLIPKRQGRPRSAHQFVWKLNSMSPSLLADRVPNLFISQMMMAL